MDDREKAEEEYREMVRRLNRVTDKDIEAWRMRQILKEQAERDRFPRP